MSELPGHREGVVTPSMFDPTPAAPPTREELERRLDELLREYSEAGGDRAREVDLEIRKLRLHLGRMPRPVPPAPPRGDEKPHDGRLAATGEREEA